MFLKVEQYRNVDFRTLAEMNEDEWENPFRQSLFKRVFMRGNDFGNQNNLVRSLRFVPGVILSVSDPIVS